ncbi:DNA mismatch repair protein Mlh3 [Mycetomoellerius zeteki]|uniref:DNA mismatch repair protein Mlh3 n=1 Tax=Mycetomoellerius zeteki TaxID=64791 RepID=UPI00084E50AE|nr:PREDICTED: DNA mismatch repair protein Mlh3-like [Trachymyrmex zeteki]
MQDNTEQSTVQMLTMSNIASFGRCVIELVANSLNAHATAIAIRIHTTKCEIQVVDNGVGIPKDMLKHIAKYDAEATIGDQQQVYKLLESNNLTDIRRLADRLMITSRHQYSEETFVKAFEMGFALNLKQVEQRPSRGTTVSIYGFHEMPHKKWDTSTICFLIAAIAVTKLEVSFSIRDEEQKKVVLRIAKPHNSIEVLRTLVGKDLPLNHVWSIQCGPERNSNYHGYVGLSDKNAMQWIFLNHRPIYCPLILKLIKIVFKEKLNLFSDQKSNARDPYDENVFILFFLTFSQKEFMRVTENGKSNYHTINMISPLSEWSNWTYYTNNKKRDTTRNINIFPENDIRSRQFFERNNNQFDFLPRKLHGLLQHRHVKLTNVKCFNSPNDTIPLINILNLVAENCQHEQIAVHPCKLKQKLYEFRLSQASLKCIKIINQVNNEFIAAWMTWNEMKILLMIDQHAVHERIRYENLLLSK